MKRKKHVQVRALAKVTSEEQRHGRRAVSHLTFVSRYRYDGGNVGSFKLSLLTLKVPVTASLQFLVLDQENGSHPACLCLLELRIELIWLVHVSYVHIDM